MTLDLNGDLPKCHQPVYRDVLLHNDKKKKKNSQGLNKKKTVKKDCQGTKAMSNTSNLSLFASCCSFFIHMDITSGRTLVICCSLQPYETCI